MAMSSVRTLKRTLTGVTAALLATAGLAATAAPAQAGRIGACAQLRAFTLTLASGGDDLRNNSEVIVWLTGTPGGDTELQHVWGGIGNGSSRTYSITYQNTNWHVSSCDVTGIKVRMVSHNDVFQHNDNWNMESITLHGFSDAGAPAYAISANGTPVKRFTGSDAEWSRRG